MRCLGLCWCMNIRTPRYRMCVKKRNMYNTFYVSPIGVKSASSGRQMISHPSLKIPLSKSWCHKPRSGNIISTMLNFFLNADAQWAGMELRCSLSVYGSCTWQVYTTIKEFHLECLRFCNKFRCAYNGFQTWAIQFKNVQVVRKAWMTAVLMDSN